MERSARAIIDEFRESEKRKERSNSATVSVNAGGDVLIVKLTIMELVRIY